MSTTDTFLTVDKHLIVVGWTTGMQELFGYEPSEILGKHVFVLVPPDKADAAVEVLTRVKVDGRVVGFQTERLHKSGERLKLTVDLLSIKNMTGDHCATQISPRRR